MRSMMNYKKYCFTFSLVISLFLFVAGLLFLSLTTPNSTSTDKSNNIINNIINPFKSSNQNINILVLGGDKVSNNSDTIILVNFNPTSGKTNILSIPRDTKVTIFGKPEKINAAYPFGGAKLAVKTVSQFLNVNIDYYVFLDISAFRKIVDLLDGVDYYVPCDMKYDDPCQNLHINLKKGFQHLNGNAAEQFVRFRKYNYTKVSPYYDGSDIKRIAAQQSFVKEIIKQKSNIFYLTKLTSILNVILSSIETNFTSNDLIKFAANIDKVTTSNISTFTLPGYPLESSIAWYYICDNKQSTQLIKNYFTSNSDNSSNNDDLTYYSSTTNITRESDIYSTNNNSGIISNDKRIAKSASNNLAPTSTPNISNKKTSQNNDKQKNNSINNKNTAKSVITSPTPTSTPNISNKKTSQNNDKQKNNSINNKNTTKSVITSPTPTSTPSISNKKVSQNNDVTEATN